MFGSVKSGLQTLGKNYGFHSQKCLISSHPYDPMKHSSKVLADLLVQKSIIYQSNGLVVFNKPQGISFAENISKENGDFEVSFHTLYPFLLKKLNCKQLFNAKVPEKYASGVAVFCTDENLAKKLKNCFGSMRGCKIPAEIYEAVVTGQPAHYKGKFEGGISIESSPNGKNKGPKFIKECAKSKVRNGIVKPVYIEHSTLAVGELASRVEIIITRTKWHAVRLYAANELVAPVLGDRVFGSLVRTVLGQPVLVDMFSPAAFQPKKLPKNLISKLNLTSREDIEIPLHLHLSKLQIVNFPSKGKRLEFYADPPEHYKWTCSVLGLGYDEEEEYKAVYLDTNSNNKLKQ